MPDMRFLQLPSDDRLGIPVRRLLLVVADIWLSRDERRVEALQETINRAGWNASMTESFEYMCSRCLTNPAPPCDCLLFNKEAVSLVPAETQLLVTLTSPNGGTSVGEVVVSGDLDLLTTDGEGFEKYRTALAEATRSVLLAYQLATPGSTACTADSRKEPTT